MADEPTIVRAQMPTIEPRPPLLSPEAMNVLLDKEMEKDPEAKRLIALQNYWMLEDPRVKRSTVTHMFQDPKSGVMIRKEVPVHCQEDLENIPEFAAVSAAISAKIEEKTQILCERHQQKKWFVGVGAVV
jgi:hypothetical protein